MPDLLLAGDIGGTNVRLRLMDGDAVVREESVAGWPVVEVVAEFRRRKMNKSPVAAAFGCAGGVKDGRAHFVARKNEAISETLLADALDIPVARVRLINDMAAHLGGLDDCEFVTLRDGEPYGQVEAMVMPGTGLGCGLRVDAGGRWIPLPTEGGQVDFPATIEFADLPPLVRERTGVGRVTWEHLASASSLPLLYHAAGGDGTRTPEAIVAALDADPKAATAVARLLALIGARAGNLCLASGSTRGVWFGGGLLNSLHATHPRVFDDLIDGFTACGPEVLRPLMAAVPLRLLTTGDSGLRGAAAIARSLLA